MGVRLAGERLVGLPLAPAWPAACDARPRPSATHQLAVGRGALSGVGVGVWRRVRWARVLAHAATLCFAAVPLRLASALPQLHRHQGCRPRPLQKHTEPPLPPCIPSTRRAGRHFLPPTARLCGIARHSSKSCRRYQWPVQVRTSALPLAAPHCSIQGDRHTSRGCAGGKTATQRE